MEDMCECGGAECRETGGYLFSDGVGGGVCASGRIYESIVPADTCGYADVPDATYAATSHSSKDARTRTDMDLLDRYTIFAPEAVRCEAHAIFASIMAATSIDTFFNCRGQRRCALMLAITCIASERHDYRLRIDSLDLPNQLTRQARAMRISVSHALEKHVREARVDPAAKACSGTGAVSAPATPAVVACTPWLDRVCATAWGRLSHAGLAQAEIAATCTAARALADIAPAWAARIAEAIVPCAVLGAHGPRSDIAKRVCTEYDYRPATIVRHLSALRTITGHVIPRASSRD